MDYADAIRESRRVMLREQARMKAAGYDSIWRFRAAPVIAAVLQATKGMPEKDIKRALRAAYPFGPYAYHPLKMWRAEVRFQRKLTRTDKTPMELFAGEAD